MFKCSLDISRDIGKGQNYLRYYSKVLYILHIASLREWMLKQNTYLLIIYEQVAGEYSGTIQIPMSDMTTFQLTQMIICRVCRSLLMHWS